MALPCNLQNPMKSLNFDDQFRSRARGHNPLVHNALYTLTKPLQTKPNYEKLPSEVTVKGRTIAASESAECPRWAGPVPVSAAGGRELCESKMIRDRLG